MTRWQPGGGADYAARFAKLAASGAAVHGEADFLARVVVPPARVLDAGCGTGRIAVELSRRDFACVGVDVDSSMLAEARRADPDAIWIEADLAAMDLPALGLEAGFDVVLCAGNVIPLVAPGTEAEVVTRFAVHLRPGGLLVTGFGLDRAHLPREAAVVAIDDFDRWCSEADLRLQSRYSTWDGDAWPGGGGYAVSIHRLGED